MKFSHILLLDSLSCVTCLLHYSLQWFCTLSSNPFQLTLELNILKVIDCQEQLVADRVWILMCFCKDIVKTRDRARICVNISSVFKQHWFFWVCLFVCCKTTVCHHKERVSDLGCRNLHQRKKGVSGGPSHSPSAQYWDLPTSREALNVCPTWNTQLN